VRNGGGDGDDGLLRSPAGAEGGGTGSEIGVFHADRSPADWTGVLSQDRRVRMRVERQRLALSVQSRWDEKAIRRSTVWSARDTGFEPRLVALGSREANMDGEDSG